MPVGESTRWVLFIEDSQDQADLYSEGLALLGLNTKVASSGTRGLDSARELNPALIVLDLALPDLDGWDVIRCLRGDERTKRIPIMVLTGLPTDDGPDRARRAGCARYLLKPCNPLDLAREIRDILDECAARPA